MTHLNQWTVIELRIEIKQESEQELVIEAYTFCTITFRYWSIHFQKEWANEITDNTLNNLVMYKIRNSCANYYNVLKQIERNEKNKRNPTEAAFRRCFETMYRKKSVPEPFLKQLRG